MINRKNFDRLARFIENGTIAAGGETDADELYIAPTILVDVPVDSPIMQEEVFGPILPVLEIDSVEKVIDGSTSARPLGLYVFCGDDEIVERDPRADELGRRLRQRLRGSPVDSRAPVRRRRELRHGQVPRPLGLRGFTNPRGVLYHSPLIDPGVKHPPYSAHQTERKVMEKLL